MVDYNGEILSNSSLFVTAPQSGTASVEVVPAQAAAVLDGEGDPVAAPVQLSGVSDGYGQHRLMALPSSQINPIPRYSLSCEDNTGARHYWVDTSISLTFAPVGFIYVSATLTVEGKF